MLNIPKQREIIIKIHNPVVIRGFLCFVCTAFYDFKIFFLKYNYLTKNIKEQCYLFGKTRKVLQSDNKTIEKHKTSKGKVLKVNVYLLFKVLFEDILHICLYHNSPFCFYTKNIKLKFFFLFRRKQIT